MENKTQATKKETVYDKIKTSPRGRDLLVICLSAIFMIFIAIAIISSY